MKRNKHNIERKCEVCGKPFITKTARQITCSFDCSEERHRQYIKEYNRNNRKYEKESNLECKCPECGRKFIKDYRNQVTCSKECKKDREKRLKKERSRRHRIEAEEKKIKEKGTGKEKGISDLSSKAREADEKGTTYGKLVALEMMEREKQSKKRR